MQFSENQQTSDKMCTNEKEQDIISYLPTEILHKILTFLPTKDAVATSALSRRWENLWTTARLSRLEFNDITPTHGKRPNPNHDKILFVKFVNNVLRRADLAKVSFLSLSCLEPYGSSRVYSWLSAACMHNNIVELDIYINFFQDFIRLPASVYTSTSLKVLKLNANVKLDIDNYKVCFPSLKILHIFVYNQEDIDLTRRLYSRCPVLEDLFLKGQMLKRDREIKFYVCSSTLKRLRVEFSLAGSFCCVDYSFLVEAENLECLDVSDNFLAKYRFVNLQVLDRAKIGIGHPSLSSGFVGFGFANRAFEFLRSLSHVKYLSLSGCTVTALSYINESKFEFGDNVDDDEDDDRSENRYDRLQSLGNLTTFSCLINLELGFRSYCNLTILPCILRCSPNLQYLALKKEIVGGVELERDKRLWKLEPVPKCMLNCLKGIDIKGFEGKHFELIVLESLLKNAQVLEWVAIYSSPLSSDEEMMLHKSIIEYPRGSEACQVKFFSNSLVQP